MSAKITNIADLDNDESNQKFMDELAGRETPKELLGHLNHSQSRYRTRHEEFVLDYDRQRVVFYRKQATGDEWESDDLGLDMYPTIG